MFEALYQQNPIDIKIRPLWDWNIDLVVLTGFLMVIKIRPLWDWNTYSMS